MSFWADEPANIRWQPTAAQVLLRAKRFDGAFYLCGYSVELALKARICRSVVRDGNPEKRYQSIGQSTQQQATDMLTCAKRLLAVIRRDQCPGPSRHDRWSEIFRR